MKYPKVLARSFLDFFRDGGLMLAGSLSYFFMMALVPFCLFLITIFGQILGSYSGFYDFLAVRLVNFFPSITKEITEQLGKLIAFKGIGPFSVVLYGLLSFQLFSAIESALNTIFKVKQGRSLIWSIILSLLTVTLVITVTLVSFVATSLVPLLKMKLLRQVFPELRIGFITAFLIQYVIPFLMILFTITVIYIFFPRAKVRGRQALAGALFAAVFLEFAKHVFTWYVGTVIKFGTIYGPLAAFVMFLLWVFYSSCIFLAGAETVHNLSSSKTRR